MRLKISSLIIFSILFFISQTPIFPGENPKNLYGESGFYVNGMDTTVDPGQDFYQYAVGNWLKNNPIPDEYSYWGSFLVLHDNNQKNLHKILEDALNNTTAPKGSIIQKVGDFYYTGMDTVKIMEQGIAPIKLDLENINSMKSSNDFYKELAYIQMVALNPLFSFGSGADAKNSDLDIAQLYQSGLGLPDRDYYVNDDDRSKDMREKYVIHIANMFKLLGEDEETAKADAKRVMDIETRLAKVSMTQVEQRDPNALYNKMSLNSLQEDIPDFNWTAYFNEFGITDPGDINIGQPKFFKEIGQMVKEYSINDWKPYFKWKLISGTANYLTDDFVNEKFNFYGKYLNGSKVLQPRWKRVLSSINGHIGDALGQLYVKDYFPPEAKQKAHDIVMSLLKAMGERIQSVDWMSDQTKEKAIEKLHAFKVKIGYPDKWIDYSNLNINKDSYYANVKRANIFEFKRDLAKIGKPVDKTEWLLNAQTVNAYYSGERNEIAFPAAILQPPFFNLNADDAVNYGAMGAVIGHEITHGFDDEGRQFDANGNLTDWWTKEDSKKFDDKAKVMIEQFNKYSPIDTFHVNGQLTQGENIADLGGLNVALTAFKKTDEYKEGKKIDGFTPVQRFFFGWAQVWESNSRDQSILMALKVDPHSPDKFRVNGPLSNMPEFWEAFNIKPDQPMRRTGEKVIKIW